MRRDLFAKIARRRLAAERGRIDKEAPFTVALCYPSPYRVGMSSLGYLSIYRAIQNESKRIITYFSVYIYGKCIGRRRLVICPPGIGKPGIPL